ncbi:hypothetical protein Nmel_009096 [Mimus melanotis]
MGKKKSVQVASKNSVLQYCNKQYCKG